MEQEPLISVIIPTYNREKTIDRAVDSVLKQTYSNLEVIVVDDGSSDRTEEIVKGISDPRVRFYKLPQNGGAGHARNEGVKLAGGELIAFHDSDDVWRPEKLQRQMAYWQEHPEFSMVYCGYLCHLENGKTRRVPGEEMEELEGDIFVPLLRRNTIGAPTILIKKNSFCECGGFDITLKSLEDWEFALRFAKQNKIGYVGEQLVDVYLNGNGVSSGAGAYFEGRCQMLTRYYAELTKTGLLDQAVTDLFLRAEQCGTLEKVKRMLLLMLQRG